MEWRVWARGRRAKVGVARVFAAAVVATVVGGEPALAAALPGGVAFHAQAPAQGRFSTVGQLGEAITARMREVGSARVTQTGQVTLPILEIEVSGDGAVRYVAEPEFELTTRFEGPDLPSTETHVIVDQGMFYYMVSGFEIEPGRPWARQPVDATGGEQPTRLVFDAERFLEQIVTDPAVEFVGQELVDGEPTEGYRITLDLGAVLDDVLGVPAEGSLGETPFVTYFLDQEDTVRKVVLDFPGLATMTFAFYDFGAPLEITAPPPDQVAA